MTETTRVTIALKPGTVSEKVEISAQVATVDTTAATTGTTLGPETIRERPSGHAKLPAAAHPQHRCAKRTERFGATRARGHKGIRERAA